MLPNDEQLQISDAARQFAQERLKPFAADWDREHRFPKEAIAEMAELGFFGMLVPCLLYTSPSPRDQRGSRMPSSA